jgi:hypothetical protein
MHEIQDQTPVSLQEKTKATGWLFRYCPNEYTWPVKDNAD